jgi:hypothetical protein
VLGLGDRRAGEEGQTKAVMAHRVLTREEKERKAVSAERGQQPKGTHLRVHHRIDRHPFELWRLGSLWCDISGERNDDSADEVIDPSHRVLLLDEDEHIRGQVPNREIPFEGLVGAAVGDVQRDVMKGLHLGADPHLRWRSERTQRRGRERGEGLTSKLGRVADMYLAPKTLMMTLPTICTGAEPPIGIEERREGELDEEVGAAQAGGLRPKAFPEWISETRTRGKGRAQTVPGYHGLSLLLLLLLVVDFLSLCFGGSSTGGFDLTESMEDSLWMCLSLVSATSVLEF